MNEFCQFVSQVGFPIVACAALFWQNDKQDKRHQEETEKLTLALNSNTAAIAKLEAAIDRGHYHEE